MNKIYFLTLFLLTISIGLNAQFTDDLESYDEGSLFTDMWTTWDGNDDGVQNAFISTDQSFSGDKSIFIGVAGTNPQDAVLDFGGVATSGKWNLSWMMYVPAGNSAYINLQGSVTPNANANLQFVSGNIYFNQTNGSPGIGEDDNGQIFFNFPHDEWFPISVEVDVTNQNYAFTVNGVLLETRPFGGAITEFGGLDLFQLEAETAYYVDDFSLEELITSVEDIASAGFLIYPNPVQDLLIIESVLPENNIQIFDITGKLVLETFSRQEITRIDLGHLEDGTYLVNIFSDQFSRTEKLVK